MPERKFSSLDYRYGFNGKEMDNEVKGLGSQQDSGARINNSQLGRFLSIDPLQKKYPMESNYAFTSNNPIFYADADGRDKITTISVINKDGSVTILKRTDFRYLTI